MDLCDLFVEPRIIPRYSSVYSELTAVKNRQKAMSAFWFHEHAELKKRVEYLEVVEGASRLGLQCTQELKTHSNGLVERYLFVSYPEEAWRWKAILATVSALERYPWSNAAEYLQSHWLGFSDEDTEAYLQEWRWRRLGWVGRSVYALFSRAELRGMISIGLRALPPMDAVGVRLVIPNLVLSLRKDAAALVLPKIIGRASVDNEVVCAVANKRGWKGVEQVILASHTSEQVNVGTRAGWEFLFQGGWVDGVDAVREIGRLLG